MTSGNEKLSHS